MVSPYLTPIRPSVINAGGKIQDWTLSGLAFHATGTNNTIWSPIVPPASGDGYWACPNANLIASGASTFTSTIVFADKDKATIESFALESVTIGGDAVENNGEKEASTPHILLLTTGKTVEYVKYTIDGTNYDWRCTSTKLYKLGSVSKTVALIPVD
jgi:hypothetical protein